MTGKAALQRVRALVFGVTTLFGSGAAWADVYDGGDDALVARMRDVIHGSEEIHDLAARPGPVADVDWVFLPQDPYTSWEVAIDGVTASAGVLDLQRLDTAGVLLQTGVLPTAASTYSRRLTFSNAGPGTIISAIRVQGADCATACSATAQYRLRVRDTTITVPRFNNSGGQATVLLVQNPRPIAHSGTIYFWSAAGALVGTFPLSITAQGLLVLSTQTVVPGVSGSITIVHDAGYGGLVAKAVALEPATGFSFDTPGVNRPY